LYPPGKPGITYCVITRDTPVPPWRQLAAIIRARIESGELAPGTRLPSALELAGEYQVSVPTVRKAIDRLKADGLITGVAGYGTFVADSAAEGQAEP